MNRSVAALGELLAEDVPVYGESTGFGPHVRYDVDAGDPHTNQGAGLLAHLGAGVGESAPRDVVRAVIFLRTLTISRGYSAVRPDVAAAYASLLCLPVYPVIPVHGSVGASGDLVPLSYPARALTGEGMFRDALGTRHTAREVLKQIGLQPVDFRGREALALTNGVSWSAAWVCFALREAYTLMRSMEVLTAWIYDLLGSPRAALDERLHFARGHVDQVAAAGAVRLASAQAGAPSGARPLQEPYSIRCAPQILGACRAQLEYADALMKAEINGVSDNPLIFHDGEGRAVVLHGGNFFGQQIAFAADALNAAMTQIGLLAERQIALLLNPEKNDGAPLLLAWRRGHDSGLAGVQITATSLAAEMRSHCSMFSVSTIPTNGDNQDIVSMSCAAARAARGQADRLAYIEAALLITISRLNDLRREKRAPGDAVPGPESLPHVNGFQQDQPMDDELRRLAAHLLNR